MSGNLGWDQVPSSSSERKGSGTGSGDLFMKLGEGKHQVRLVGTPIKINVVWINKQKYVVPDNYVSRLEAIGQKPRIFFAINIFDREDTKNGVTRLKILEKGTSVFENFKAYKEEVEVDPGGSKGPDFRITVNVPQDKRQTTYRVLPLPKETPFTEKELELLSRPKKMDPEELKKLPLGERGLISLDKFYKLDEAGEKLEKVLSEAVGASDDEDLDSVSEKMGGDSESSLEDILGNIDDSGDDSSNSEAEESLDDILKDATF